MNKNKTLSLFLFVLLPLSFLFITIPLIINISFNEMFILVYNVYNVKLLYL